MHRGDGNDHIEYLLELDPPRLVIAYGWKDGLMGVPPESTTVEIDLDEQDGRTILSLVHRTLSPEVVDDHAYGWDFFLDRLQQAVTSGGA